VRGERFRARRGSRAHALGIDAEAAACAALERDGWTLRARRLRTKAGEVDVVAEKNGLLATLSEAAGALSARQRKRLIAAAEIVLADHPDWGAAGVRFDVLLIDAGGSVRRIADAFRREDHGA
jgi:putative endonuclease